MANQRKEWSERMLKQALFGEELEQDLSGLSGEEIHQRHLAKIYEEIRQRHLYEEGSDTEDERESANEKLEKEGIENERLYLEDENAYYEYQKIDVTNGKHFCCYHQETDDYYESLLMLRKEIENMTDIFEISHYVRWTTQEMENLLTCWVMPLSYYEAWNNDLKQYFQQG
jgi:hypothetical protein